MEIISIDENSFEIEIDNKIYSTEVVHKCLYWYSGNFSVEITSKENSFVVKISNRKESWNIENVIDKVRIDLIDFKTREIISNETKNIREILVAKAFAHSDEFDELPPGHINDPLGFDPTKIFL